MALGEITKQLAKQAIGNQVSEMLDPKAPQTAAPTRPENLGNVIIGQVQAMQKALKEDQELAVHFNTGAEVIRIMEIYVPSWQLFVLTGMDSSRSLTRVISPAESTQLVCKVMKLQAGATPQKINVILPKA